MKKHTRTLRSIPLLWLCFLFLLTGCYAPIVLTTSIPTLPTRNFQSLPGKIVVASAFDAKQTSVRDNKEKLFSELTDLTVRQVSNEINRRSEIPATFIEGVAMLKSQPDSSVKKLMNASLATHAIIINSFNASFEQTHVDVTVNDSGSKNRQAFYDLIIDIGYTFHNPAGRHFDTLISARKFHSSRSVLSGLLAAGPNIVSNREDAIEGIYANVDMYLKSFFSGREERTRTIFSAKQFQEVTSLIYASEYEKAFQLCEQSMTLPDTYKAAMAAYNCAVLLEYMGRYDEVKYYLLESKRLNYLPDTDHMLLDYRMYKAHR